MSMIGLLAGTPPAATAKAASGDAAAAGGFGSTLQGALDALAETAPNLQGEPEEPTAELEQGGQGEDAGLSVPKPVELAEMSVLQTQPASIGSAVPSTDGGLSVPKLPVETTPELRQVLLDSTRSSAGVAPGTDTGLGLSQPAQSSEAPEPRHVQLVSASSTRGGAPSSDGGFSVSKPVEPAETPEPQAQLISTSLSRGGAPSSDGDLSLSKPVEPAETPELRQARPVSTSSAHGGVPLAETPVLRPVQSAPTSSTPSASGADGASRGAAEAVQAPTVAAAPVSVPAGAPQPVTPAATVAAGAAAASVPFATQLARPIFSIAAAGAGEHVLTVSVTPDNLGPVTVRAHVGAEGVRVELFAPNDLGRDAIRAIIPELRRDLAGAGLGGNLSLSSQNQPSPDGSAHGSGAGHSGEQGERWTARSTPASADHGLMPAEQQIDRSGLFGTTSTIDVLA